MVEEINIDVSSKFPTLPNARKSDDMVDLLQAKGLKLPIYDERDIKLSADITTNNH